MLRQALQLFCDSIRRRGLFPTARRTASRLIYFLQDSTPERRRARFGDLDFDVENNVDTTSARQSLGTRLRGLLTGSEYQATDPETFHEIMAALPVAPEEFTFVELGSGKGRAVLLASEYPFRRIIGVELLPELHVVAQHNLVRFARERRRCANIDLLCADARTFTFPNEPIVVYLFNPFPEVVLEDVMANLRSSADSAPRPIYVVYYNLVLPDVVERGGWLKQIGGTERWRIYRNLVIS